MRVEIDLPEDQLTALDRLAAVQQRPRDTLISEAIGAYVAEYRRGARGKAFGLWGDREVDGLEYQRKLRDEW